MFVGSYLQKISVMPVLLALFLFKKVQFKMQLWQKCVAMLHE
jgi:hypothetical protein